MPTAAIHWHAIDETTLAHTLGAGPIQNASAVGLATVYELERDGHPQLAIALPGGGGILLEIQKTLAQERRQTARPRVKT